MKKIYINFAEEGLGVPKIRTSKHIDDKREFVKEEVDCCLNCMEDDCIFGTCEHFKKTQRRIRESRNNGKG